jgi:hypothetical protein
MLALVSAADRDPALRPRLRELIRELRAASLARWVLPGSGRRRPVAFLHTVVVGTAVLQLARDDAPARQETRKCCSGRSRSPGKG